MPSYPVDIKQTSSDSFRAIWVDFPDLPRGLGQDAQSAFNSLVDASFSLIADVVARNLHPKPSPSEGRPVVAFSEPSVLAPHHVARLLSVTRNGTQMTTYSYTNDFSYIE